MVSVSGFTLTKQLTKESGQVQKKNGQGVETWPNGYIYKGEFKNSEWSGIGILTFPDGSTYEGEWYKDERHGNGKKSYSSGEFYEG